MRLSCPYWWLCVLVGFCGSVVFAVGAAAFLGYVLAIERLYRWSDTPMAINTSLCFFTEGIALILLARLMWNYDCRKRK